MQKSPSQAGGTNVAVPPKVEIQTWNIERFIPYARNPSKNDAAVDRMCASIREFGFKCPVQGAETPAARRRWLAGR
jgi:hypothetical protein